MSHYSHISKEERLEIEILLGRGYSISEIGKAIGRDKGTISREIRRNKVRGEYIGKKATQKSYQRRHNCKIEMKKIRWNSELESYIRNRIINERWSPEQIAGRWNKEHEGYQISYVRIYEYIETIRGQDIKEVMWNRRKRRHKKKKGRERVKIQNRVGIEKREIGEGEFGHYECDSMEGVRGDRGLLSTRIEKISRYMFADKLEGKGAKDTEERLREWIERTRDIKTLTFDNGLEFANHYKLGVKTYFCDPYSSWQKGQIERGNREIRKFIPKKTKLSSITNTELQNIIKIVNNTPRKCLGWNTPYEVFSSYNAVALEI